MPDKSKIYVCPICKQPALRYSCLLQSWVCGNCHHAFEGFPIIECPDCGKVIYSVKPHHLDNIEAIQDQVLAFVEKCNGYDEPKRSNSLILFGKMLRDMAVKVEEDGGVQGIMENTLMVTFHRKDKTPLGPYKVTGFDFNGSSVAYGVPSKMNGIPVTKHFFRPIRDGTFEGELLFLRKSQSPNGNLGDPHEMSNFDDTWTWKTDQPVCPHCGHIETDDIDDMEGTATCSVCENDYWVTMTHYVDYTTGKIGKTDDRKVSSVDNKISDGDKS